MVYFDADSTYAGLPDNAGKRGANDGLATVLAYDGFQPYRKNARPASDSNSPQFGFSRQRRRLDPHYNDDSYQIISEGPDAGLRGVDGDGQLEAVGLGRGGRPSVAGEPFSGEDADNITNFSDGWSIGGFMRPLPSTAPSSPSLVVLLILLAIFVFIAGAVIFFRVRRRGLRNLPSTTYEASGVSRHNRSE